MRKGTDVDISRCGGLRGLVRIMGALLCSWLMVCALGGCNTDGCADNRSALPLMAFYSATTDAPLVLDSVAIGGVDAPSDSLLVFPGQSTMSAYLPFRFDKSSTSFFIHYAYREQGLDDPRLNDTITFHYTSRPYFASEECGALFVYEINRVDYTRHLIESVVITDSVVTNVDMERIRVYIRTSETETTAAGKGVAL